MAAIDGVARLGLSVRSLGGDIKSFMGEKGSCIGVWTLYSVYRLSSGD